MDCHLWTTWQSKFVWLEDPNSWKGGKYMHWNNHGMKSPFEIFRKFYKPWGSSPENSNAISLYSRMWLTQQRKKMNIALSSAHTVEWNQFLYNICVKPGRTVSIRIFVPCTFQRAGPWMDNYLYQGYNARHKLFVVIDCRWATQKIHWFSLGI